MNPLVSLKVFFIVYILGVFIMTVEAKNYHYSINAGNPTNYPMQYDFYNNYFFDEKKNRFLNFYPAGGGESYWGTGSQSTLLSENNPLPYGVHVQWFSVVENVFWEGEYVFNQSLFNSLKNYTVLNILNRQVLPFKASFDFVINIVPGGMVTIWIKGGGEQLLLGTFQAKRINQEPSWESFYRSTQLSYYMGREEYRRFKIDGSKKYIQESFNNVSERFNTEQPSGQLTSIPWQKTMKTYSWYLAINDQYFTLRDYRADYVNGELKYTYFDMDQLVNNRAVPYEISFYYQEKQNNNKLERADIYFDSDEIMQAFREIALTPPLETTIKLYIDFNPSYESIFAYLVKGNKKIELDKITAKRPDLYNSSVNIPWPEQVNRYK